MILVFDTETTGLPDFKLAADHPSQPRICSIAAVLVEPAGATVEELDTLIAPDGWMMPAEVTAIHGLTLEDCQTRGVPIKDALTRFDAMMDRAATVVGFGIEFDLKMLRGEYRRAGMPDRYGEKPKRCLMRECTPLCKIPPTNAMMSSGRYTFKTPKLIEAVDILLGEKLEGAHQAINDVRATVRLLFHLMAKEGTTND